MYSRFSKIPLTTTHYQALTNKSNVLLNLINSTPRNEAAGLRNESIHIALTSFPVVNWDVANTTYVAQCGQWGVQKQREQGAMVLHVLECRRNILRRHQNHHRLAKVSERTTYFSIRVSSDTHAPHATTHLGMC